VFARIVSMRLKPNMSAEFSQTIEKKILPILRKQKGFRDEITFLAPGGTDAVGISLWDSRAHADAYNSRSYPEVLRELNKVVEETKRSNLRRRQFHGVPDRCSTGSVIGKPRLPPGVNSCALQGNFFRSRLPVDFISKWFTRSCHVCASR